MDGPCNCISSAFSKHRKSKCLLRNVCNIHDTAAPSPQVKAMKDASVGTSVKKCFCSKTVTYEHYNGKCHAPLERKREVRQINELLDKADTSCGIYRSVKKILICQMLETVS